MKFLKKFATRAEYEAYMVGNENYPFVVYIADEKKVEYHPLLDFSSMPFYVKALEDMTVSFTTNPIQYSLDNEAWVDLPVGESTPTIAAGDKVYFKAEGLTPTSSEGIGTFNIVGRCNLGGNIMSLLYGDDFVDKVYIGKEYFFYKLFYQQTSIVHAGNLVLPATTLQPNCYKNMFNGCTSLTNAPKILPATTLAKNCYQGMFRGCTSLVNAPELPATTLVDYCYESMFYDCTSLVNAPKILPATNLVDYCYQYMFYGCTSLVTAPVLLARSLDSYCCQYMFYDCTNLQYIKAMFTSAPSVHYTGSWVYGVKSVGTFVKSAAATWNVTGSNGIPSGWTIETATE